MVSEKAHHGFLPYSKDQCVGVRGDSKLPEDVNGCLSSCILPLMNCRPVQSVPLALWKLGRPVLPLHPWPGWEIKKMDGGKGKSKKEPHLANLYTTTSSKFAILQMQISKMIYSSCVSEYVRGTHCSKLFAKSGQWGHPPRVWVGNFSVLATWLYLYISILPSTFTSTKKCMKIKNIYQQTIIPGSVEQAPETAFRCIVKPPGE